MQGASCVRENTGWMKSTISFCRICILSSSNYLAQNSACSFSVECTLSLHPDVSLQIINRASSRFGNGQSFETLTINIAVYHVVFALCEEICRGKPDSDFSPSFLLQHFWINSEIKSELKWIPKVNLGVST